MPKSSEDSYLDPSRTAIVDLVEHQRREVRRLATEEIRMLEDRRDRDLGTLDDVIGALEGRKGKEVAPPTSSVSAPAPSRRSRTRRRRKKRGSPTQVALENREAILRHLEGADRQMAAGEIRGPLGISEHANANALKRLVSEGKVARVGSGSGTRYEVTRKSRRAVSGVDHGQGTLEGRILLILEDRGFVSDPELSQALRVPVEKVQEVCAGLIAEGEIRVSNRGGARVYVRLRVA